MMSTVNQHLQQIEASGLIRLAAIEPDLQYLFRHALVQDAAYESLLRQDRKKLHLSVAETLEDLYPDHPDDLAPMLANHFYLADDGRALKYYLQAGDVAYCMYANREAVMHYTRALDVSEWPNSGITSQQLVNLCQRCGRAYQFASQLDGAIAFYAQITEMAHRRGDRALELAAQVEYATLLCTPNEKNDFSKGAAICEQMLGLARELGDRRAEVKILWTSMLPERFGGDPQTAIRRGQEALAIARELEWHDQIAYILNDLSFCYAISNQFAKGISANQEAGELWRKVGNLPMLADNRAGAVAFHLMGGQLDEAIAASNDAYQISQSIDNLWGQSYSGLMVDLIYLYRGEFDKVFEVAERTLRLGEMAGFLAPRINTRATLGLAYGYLGAKQEAVAHASQAHRESVENQLPWLSMGQAVLARLYCMFGDLENAEKYVKESYDSLGSGKLGEASPATGWVPFADAELSLLKGDYAHALAVISELEHYLAINGEYGAIPYIPEGLCLKGKALMGLGQLEVARDTFREARERASAMGARWFLWQLWHNLSQVEIMLGNPAEAHHCDQQAREILTFIIDHIGQANLRETFLALPQVHAVMNND